MNDFDALPIIGILRGFNASQTEQIIEAAIRGGLRNIEITMNTPDAAGQIRRAARGNLNIGAGTVLTRATLDEALEAGAKFIVTPTVQTDIIAECVRQKIPVFPGAFSPTEVLRAWDLGAAMVKIFPAETLGPAYVRALKAPLPHVRLLPTGGVDLQTLPAFLKAGASGFGIGSPLFDKARIEACDWLWIQARCAAFAQVYCASLG